MPALSVIIPIYGVENYIEKCARSLFRQTLSDIEYVFVNDCTPDRSMDILKGILDEFPARKDQVTIIEMEVNSGQAEVRRRGIEIATGEYIIHCDSDDFVDSDMYECMYNLAISGEYDIVSCDFFRGKGNHWNYNSSNLSNKSELIEDILYMPFGGALWNKLVKSRIVKDPSIIYPKMNVAEDLALTIQYALRAKSVGHVINKALYYYTIRDNSTIRNYSYEKIIDNNHQHRSNLDIAIQAIDSFGLSLKYSEAVMHHKLGIKNNLLQIMSNRDIVKEWRYIYKEINNKVLSSKSFSFKEKLNFIITYLGLYPTYYRIKH